MDYVEIYNSIPDNNWRTSKEIGYSSASLNAMCTRGMLDKKVEKVCMYRKIPSKLITILTNVQDVDFFTLMPKVGRGMLCTSKNQKVLDCWGNDYNIQDSIILQIKGKNICLTED